MDLRLWLLIFGAFLSIVSPTYAAVQQFTQYDTTVTLYENDTLKVEKTAYLRNIHQVGIVPGQVEFKINHPGEDIELLNSVVTDRYGKPIQHTIIETEDATIITLNIFTPILPGFQYQINLDYTFSYEPGGLFFKSLIVPFKEETDIAILEGTYTLNIPEGNHFSYFSFYDNATQVNKTQAIWTINKNSPSTLEFEYSFIPMSYRSFLRGSILFWAAINILLVIILLNELRREVKRIRKKKKNK